MEPANNQTQQPVQQAAPAGVPPAPPAVESTNGGFGKWLIAGVVVALIVLVFAAAYWYMTRQTTVSKPKASTNQLQNEVKSLGTELNLINIEDVEADFKEVDQDLQSL